MVNKVGCSLCDETFPDDELIQARIKRHLDWHLTARADGRNTVNGLAQFRRVE